MEISDKTVEEFDEFVEKHVSEITELINFARDKLGDAFEQNVDEVTEEQVLDEFSEIMEDDDLALNLAALYKLGIEIDVRNDYAGFIVDELIGRRIAATLTGDDPRRTLAESTFHYMDVYTDTALDSKEGAGAGYDDVIAGLAAGLQTRLPGWDWE